jgi:hypothetical protein
LSSNLFFSAAVLASQGWWEMPEITDAELDAATEAYVRERWKQVADWRKAHPAAWNETRERIRFALEAAAKIRAG